MSNSIDIPSFPKQDIKINHLETTHGSQLSMRLSFSHRSDCLKAVEFIAQILDVMIDSPANANGSKTKKKE
jgi:hypothetical protein